MNAHQEQILNYIATVQGQTLKEQLHGQDEFEAPKFYSILGALKRNGLVEKTENTGYILTQAGKDVVDFDEEEPEAEVFVAPMVHTHYMPVKEFNAPEVKVEKTKKVKKEKKVEKVEEQKDRTLYPSTPVVALNMTTLFLKDHTDFEIRKVEEKTNVTYVRFERNDHKIRAIELHHKRDIFRIYSGAQLLEPVHTFMVELGAEIKEGSHWYYDVESTVENIEKVIKFFSK